MNSTSPTHRARHKLWFVCATVVIFLLLLQSSHNLGAVALSTSRGGLLTEWTVPTPASGPWALTLDQSGLCCWFAEYYGNMVGHLDPVSGAFQEWQIPTRNANPYSLQVTTVSGRTMIWGTEFSADTVFAFFPDSGAFLEYVLPHYTTGVGYVSIEPNPKQVRVWFTETLRNSNGEFVYDLKTQNVTLYEDMFPGAVGGGAYGLVAGSSSVWFAGFTSIVRWDRASQQYSIWPLPVHGTALGRFITVDSTGQVWYTQGEVNGTSTDNFVGVLNGDLIQEWRLPASGADPRGISMNPLTGQPWITERSPSAGNGVIGVLGNSSGGTFVTIQHTTTPSGGTPLVIGPVASTSSALNSTVSPTSRQITSVSDLHFEEYGLGSNQPHDVIVDSVGNVWISEPGANKIARLSSFSSDFALTNTPRVVSISMGRSAAITETATSAAGYAGSISLSANPPAGVTLSFAPDMLKIPVGGTVSSQVTIDVSSNAELGNSSITLLGSDGSIVHSTSVLLVVTNNTTPSGTQKPQCLIATATYGSTLSPEVEFLRGFRDNVVKSRMGSYFLVMFNAWYYSFSPNIAQSINDHVFVRPIMQAVLSPLIGFLFLASQLNKPLVAYPEAATFLSGLLACVLIGGFYLGLPIGLLSRRWSSLRRLSARPFAFTLLGGIVALGLGELYVSPVLLMVSTSVIVLSAMLSAALVAKAILSR